MLSAAKEKIEQFDDDEREMEFWDKENGINNFEWIDHLQRSEATQLTSLSASDIENDLCSLRTLLRWICRSNGVNSPDDIRQHRYYQKSLEGHDVLEYRLIVFYLGLKRDGPSAPSSISGFADIIGDELSSMDRNGEISDTPRLHNMCNSISNSGTIEDTKCAVAICKMLNGSRAD